MLRLTSLVSSAPAATPDSALTSDAPAVLDAPALTNTTSTGGVEPFVLVGLVGPRALWAWWNRSPTHAPSQSQGSVLVAPRRTESRLLEGTRSSR